MGLGTDSKDYHVLQEAAKKIKGVPGLTCEIGLREGGGSQYMIDALIENEDFGRVHIAIDPYGSIPYVQSEKKTTQGNGPYPNEMMKRAVAALYTLIKGKDIDFLFFPLEDTEFFVRYAGGVPVYRSGQKEFINIYACVYIDGPHDLDSTMAETKFFDERTVSGAILVYDDVNGYYDHSKIKEYLLGHGWSEIINTGKKASYRKQ